MVEDMMAIIHCFSCRLYGLRRYIQPIQENIDKNLDNPDNSPKVASEVQIMVEIPMYAIKRELKVNNKEANWLDQCAGFSRFVYNYGLWIMKASWEFYHVKASDSKRLNAIKKVFTNVTKKSAELAWCNNYPSRIYQNAFRNLAKAFSRWRDPLLKAQMPKFKKKRHQCSFTVDDCNGKRLLFAGKQINIPTLGWFRLKEAIPYNCISQTLAYGHATRTRSPEKPGSGLCRSKSMLVPFLG